MDYTKQCWYCGKVTMQLVDSYYKCSSCGATWNEQPTLTAPDVERGSVTWSGSDGKRHRERALHPSKIAQRKAAKVRKAKGAN